VAGEKDEKRQLVYSMSLSRF